MPTILSYFVSLVVIFVCVFITLLYKYELERLFHQKKEVFVFHICNIMIILLSSFTAHAVMVIYVFKSEIDLFLQLGILLLIILVIYVIANFAYKKYLMMNRKYTISENEKVLIINEKYLRRK